MVEDARCSPGMRQRSLQRKQEIAVVERKIRQYENADESGLIRSLFYKYMLGVIYLLFAVYIKGRQMYHGVLFRFREFRYQSHWSPQLIERDVQVLDKLPHHVAVILETKPGKHKKSHYNSSEAILEGLIDDVADIACWCASSGIPHLSIYEPSGLLHGLPSSIHRAVSRRLHAYYGKARPTVRVSSPHASSFTNGDTMDDFDHEEYMDLEIVLISQEDGRESLIDLAKTLSDLAIAGKISTDSINVSLVDDAVSSGVVTEPDLLISFSPELSLLGYPPWHIRLAEI